MKAIKIPLGVFWKMDHELLFKWLNAPDEEDGPPSKRRNRTRTTAIYPSVRRVVFDRDGGICQICFKIVKWEDFVADHIIPWHITRRVNDVDNLQAAHKWCNLEKAAAERREQTKARRAAKVAKYQAAVPPPKPPA